MCLCYISHFSIKTEDSKGIDLQKRGHLTTNKTITIDSEYICFVFYVIV